MDFAICFTVRFATLPPFDIITRLFFYFSFFQFIILRLIATLPPLDILLYILVVLLEYFYFSSLTLYRICRVWSPGSRGALLLDFVYPYMK